MAVLTVGQTLPENLHVVVPSELRSLWSNKERAVIEGYHAPPHCLVIHSSSVVNTTAQYPMTPLYTSHNGNPSSASQADRASHAVIPHRMQHTK